MTALQMALHTSICRANGCVTATKCGGCAGRFAPSPRCLFPPPANLNVELRPGGGLRPTSDDAGLPCAATDRLGFAIGVTALAHLRFATLAQTAAKNGSRHRASEQTIHPNWL